MNQSQKAVAYRNTEYAKIMYHAKEISEQWIEIAGSIEVYEEELLTEMTETLKIA